MSLNSNNCFLFVNHIYWLFVRCTFVLCQTVVIQLYYSESVHSFVHWTQRRWDVAVSISQH